MAKLLEYPLTIHAYDDGNRVVELSEVGPYKIRPLKKGAATETVLTALSIVQKSNDVAFLPSLLVREFSSPSNIQKIEVTDLSHHSEEIFFSAHIDRVSKQLFDRMVQKCVDFI